MINTVEVSECNTIQPDVCESDDNAGDEELDHEAEDCVGQPVARLSPVLMVIR